MTILSLLIAPHPVLRTKAVLVVPAEKATLHLVDALCEQMLSLETLGVSAPMFGISKRVIVVRDQAEDKLCLMINPEIMKFSSEKQAFEEGSPSYPGISAFVERPEKISLQYYDLQGDVQELEAQGLLSTVIQHQMDYLEGKSFLDHLSSLKKNLLLKKMEQVKKELKRNHHVHGPHCHHD